MIKHISKSLVFVFLLFTNSCSIFTPVKLHAEDDPQRQMLVHEEPVERPLEVLFIGNSYTFFNNMPEMLTQLAINSDNTYLIQSEMAVAPAATLQRLWERGLAREAIRKKQWDFVVLQEQSLRPMEDPESMHKYARLFNSEIKRNGAKTVFYLTWARDGVPETQPLLDHAYVTIADELDAMIAPVGPAWQQVLETAPPNLLYRNDGSHPTPAGSYLAACMFYLVMTNGEHECSLIENDEITPENMLFTGRAAYSIWSNNSAVSYFNVSSR